MFPKVFTYLKFILKSKNQHGVHSPFVFDLVTKCFYKRSISNEFKRHASYRRELKSNQSVIQVSDFGAGSKVFDSNQRKISRIAKHVSISKKRAKLLFRIVRYFQSKRILEIGTSLGISTSVLSLANKNGEIATIEGCKETANVAREMFDSYNLKNIDLHVGKFQELLPKIASQKKYDLIYFDGNHTKEATLTYFKQCLPSVHNNSVFIFDDIHWSKEMEEAWEEIKQNEEVTVTIDTYQWGFVFFRKEQQKEHFTIRV